MLTWLVTLRNSDMSASSYRSRISLWYAERRPTVTRSFLLASLITLLLLWIVNPATLLHRTYQPVGYQPDGAYIGRIATNRYAGAAPSVLVVGGSSMRNMVLPGNRGSAWLSARCGRQVTIFNAAASSQNPSESWTVVDALGRPPEVIVVGLTSRRLTRSRLVDPYDLEDQRAELPLSTNAVLQSLTHADLRGGPVDFFGQIKRMQWSISALFTDLRGLPRPDIDRDNSDRGPLLDAPLPSEQKRYIVDKLIVASDGDLARTGDEMADYWVGFAREMRRRGSTTLFVVNPLSEETAGLQKMEAAPMKAALSAIARNSPVLDLRNAGNLSASDFIDPLHVSDSGRERSWPSIGEAVLREMTCVSTGAAGP